MKDVVLIVFMIAQQPEAAAGTFASAAEEVLGPRARVHLQFVDHDPPDEVAESSDGAAGVIELSFSSDRAQAHLHCYLPSVERWVDRTITFDQQDAEAERARLLGFAVASMFTDTAAAPEPEPGLQTEQEPDAGTSRPRGDEPSEVEPQPAWSDRPATVEDEAATRSNSTAMAGLGFSGLATTGIGGQARNVGASAALSLPIAPTLWSRGSLSGRVGEIAAAQAHTRELVAGLGLSWTWLETDSNVEAGTRLDLLATWLEVGHLSPDDPTVDRRTRWLPGGDLLATVGVELATTTVLQLAAGVEGRFGKTDIYTHGTRVAVIPPLRLTAELGVESRF